MTAGQILYVFVGQQGSLTANSFNGGAWNVGTQGGGGGATDIRTDNSSLTSRLVVGGGGGGSCFCGVGGAGGSPSGGNAPLNCGPGPASTAMGGLTTAGGAGAIFHSSGVACNGTASRLESEAQLRLHVPMQTREVGEAVIMEVVEELIVVVVVVQVFLRALPLYSPTVLTLVTVTPILLSASCQLHQYRLLRCQRHCQLRRLRINRFNYQHLSLLWLPRLHQL